jgi:hypothetical protein
LSADELLANLRRRRQGEDERRSADVDNKFSINSPRKKGGDEPAKNASAAAGGKGSILIKLPDNIEEQMNRHRNDRQRMREAMLGFPAIFPTHSNENSADERSDDDDDAEDDDDDDQGSILPNFVSAEIFFAEFSSFMDCRSPC